MVIQFQTCSLNRPLLLFAFWVLAQTISGQTALQKTTNYWKGATAQVGLHQTHFFDGTYNQRRVAEILKPGTGIQAGLTWIPYPFIVDLTFFHSGYKVQDGFSSYIGDEEDTTVGHSGGEVAINLALLPQVPALQPTIGVGYQMASLGINLSGEEGNRSGIPLSTAIYKLGLFARIKQVGLRAEYKRSISNDTRPKFYQFGFSLHLNMEATFGNN